MFTANFADAVREVFSYLQTCGFTESAAEEHEVIFSRGDWKIAVFFDSFEFAISLSIANSGRRFEIHSFIAAFDPVEFSQAAVLKARNNGELRSSLESLSQRLQKYGARALSGEPAVMEFVASAVEAADARRG